MIQLETKEQIQSYAESQLRKYDCLQLKGWTFRIGRTVSAVAIYRYDIRVIEFSCHFIGRMSTEAIREAIHHEIAHVIAGHDAGHGKEWKDVMKGFGYEDAKRFIQVFSLPDPKYGLFRGERMIESFYRKPRRKFHGADMELRVL